MNIRKSILWRVYLSFALVLCLAIAVVLKVLNIQTVKGAYWRGLADSVAFKVKDIEPIRGNIYTADGSLLATSIPMYEVRLDVSKETIAKEDFYKGLDSLSFLLSQLYKDKEPAKYKQELLSARHKDSRYFLIKRNVTHLQLKTLKTFPILRLGRYRGGMIVEQKSKRILPFSLAQRTIGYKAPDNDLKPVGMEGAFDKYLSGSIGKRLMQKVSGGNWIPIKDENEVEPKDGQDIITTIDVNIQDYTTAALEKALVKHDAHHGCAVVMEVSTGQIKAIANLTREGEGNYLEDYNYALGESTEPGSTFKLATVLAILEKGGNPNTLINTEGGEKRYFDRVMKDSKEGGYGVISLKKAFAISSNVAISTAAYNLFGKNPSQFTDYLRTLKLNKPLGLSISGEGLPLLKTPRSSDWNGTTLPWMSIGYEVKMTPLQTLTLYNAVANNGVMVKPIFVTEIRNVGKAVKKYETQVINEKICSDKTLASVKEMMELTVENGTAKTIRTDAYKIAGKTGTAQVANELGSYHEQKLYQSSFVGYFPANKPKYSIIIVITNPSKGAYYGGYVSAPVFREIADKIFATTESTQSYFAYIQKLQIKHVPLPASVYSADLSKLLAEAKIPATGIEQNNEWLKVHNENIKVNVDSYPTSSGSVPDVKGMLLSDAIYVLENAGLRVRFKGKGKVNFQSKESGSSHMKNEVIELVLN
ncbi:MAG: penicillin-binding protein [Bacteroidetes bacterium]|nr:penicillin-binding protein [Bacteroidota bacterium]